MTVRFPVVLAILLLAVAAGCVQESQTPSPATRPTAPAAQEDTRTTVPALTPTPQSRVIVATLLLEVQTPGKEEVVMQPSVEVSGKTVLDAVVTINGNVVPVETSGEFSTNVDLESGPNTITIVANDFQGNEQARVLTVIYVP